MIRATLDDVERINRWVHRDSGERADFTDFIADPRNVYLIDGEGGAAFLQREPDLYEVHVGFEQRGREVIELSHRMLAWMRENVGARRFAGIIPLNDSKQSRKVRIFVRLMGWKLLGTDQGCEVYLGE